MKRNPPWSGLRYSVKLEEYYHGPESLAHKETKERIGRQMQEIGYTVELERYVFPNGRSYAVDVYAEKDGEIVILEVGDCKKWKLADLRSQYPVVLQVPK
jgi:hypothetical protein